jgi:hypothetical protein
VNPAAPLRRNGRRYRPPAHIGPNRTHGLSSTYAHGCRCDDCREAWRIDRLAVHRAKRRIEKLEEARQMLREAGEL